MRQNAARPTAVTTTAAMLAAALVTAVTLAAAVALALPAAGAAARTATAPGPWAEQVCAALADWSAATQQKAATLKQKLNPESLPQARAAFSRFLDDVVHETDRMIVRVDIAGTPAIRSGPAIRQRLRALLVRARGLIADARRTAAGLSLTDRARFAKGAGSIGDSIGAQFDALGGAFDQLDRAYPSPALDRAVSHAASCKGL